MADVRKKMRQYRRKPVMISKFVWYSEEPKGLRIVHEIYSNDGQSYIRTDQFVIPWAKIMDSVASQEPRP